MNNKEKIKEYINEQIAQLDFRTKAYVFDNENRKRPSRNIFVKIQSHFDKFIAGNSAFRWITLTGLRGAGKTTILYQLYYKNKNLDGYFLALSMDEVVQTLDSSITEIIENFEEIIGKSISNLDKPLFLFIDEVQYDSNWGIALKTVFDKSNKVFVFSTGSAAVLMNMNADVARRAIHERIYPLSFREFIKIKYNRFEERDLALGLRDIFFLEGDAKDVFKKLKLQEQKINKYYLNISRLDFENYLYYGSLPFMIALENESIIYDQINKSLERVIYKDMPQIESLSTDVINKIPAILYAIADMDAFNFSSLASRFELSRVKVGEIFSILEKTEVIHRIYPFGSHFNQVTKKPSKYLFSSPAFRAMYYKMIGNTISEENARGKLLEDLVGMYLYRFVDNQPGFSLIYDSAQGGADFIFKAFNSIVAIEVGVNKKEYRQVIKTAEKIKANYSIIISEKINFLEYNEEANAIKIPLKYFMLI
jgi:predicted AAA+ superfamily ATPase